MHDCKPGVKYRPPVRCRLRKQPVPFTNASLGRITPKKWLLRRRLALVEGLVSFFLALSAFSNLIFYNLQFTLSSSFSCHYKHTQVRRKWIHMQNDYNIACKFTQSNIRAADASQYLTWCTGNVITQCVSLGKFEEQSKSFICFPLCQDQLFSLSGILKAFCTPS